MDTRYWGPSGWQLLHLIAATKGAPKSFWETLPYILPCKFCRASLSDFYKQLPVPETHQDIWLYKIHNKVNAKLRSQKHIEPDPKQSDVISHYKNLLEQGCTKTFFPGWEFVFSIADNHPASSPSKPMPDAPVSMPKTHEELNRYNLLTAIQRIQHVKEFWKELANALPFKEWQQSWKKHATSITPAVNNRRSALSWLWKVRCGMDKDLQQLSNTNFHGLCKEVAKHRSGCSTSRRAKTCRSIKHMKTRKHH